jgi:hypothetical protein
MQRQEEIQKELEAVGDDLDRMSVVGCCYCCWLLAAAGFVAIYLLLAMLRPPLLADVPLAAMSCPGCPSRHGCIVLHVRLPWSNKVSSACEWNPWSPSQKAP